VIFNGDNYEQAWQVEAAKRGLPNFRTTVEALPALTEKKAYDLFKEAGVLSRTELKSRSVIAYEKFAVQVTIEAHTLTSMARTQVLPAALRHQAELAETVGATEAADVDASDTRTMLEDHVDLVTRFTAALRALEKALVSHDGDAKKHAQHAQDVVRPAMGEVRALCDELERRVAADLWTLPRYRELLKIR
jgi:glutamine synthetase